ncbi:MAG: hypothetical protein U5K28_10450 [Halobacteriales archaeon]|nr:hypothetical protein [Halobacteriales archaeon]
MSRQRSRRALARLRREWQRWLAPVPTEHAVTLFLLACVLFASYWRIDVFIVDTVAVANALANVADGTLQISTVYYGPPDAQTPGVYAHGGRLYGRNYGHVFAALPVLLLLRAVAVIAEPAVVLAGLWSLGVAVVGRRLSRAFDTPAYGLVGALVAGFLFVLNVVGGTAIAPRLFPLVALQFVILVAGGGLVATMYLLVSLFHGHRVGVAAAVATMLAGPIGFWATIPKRHLATAFLVLLSVYCFARSRHTERLFDRALAYVPVGLTAWISAPEGFLLLVSLGTVDVATSRRRDPRTLATLAVVLFISLVPFFVTNFLISGNPLQPPRLLTSYRAGGASVTTQPAVAPSNPAEPLGGVDSPSPSDGGSGGSGGSAGGGGETDGGGSDSSGGGSTGGGGETDGGGSSGGGPTVVESLLATVGGLLSRVLGQFERGLTAIAPERLYHVFVRSGRIPGVDYGQTGGETIELTLLETAPVLAALVAAPGYYLREQLGRDGTGSSLAGIRRRLSLPTDDPARATDLFAVVFTVLFSLVYLPRLPVHGMITVRYLIPTVPLFIYGVARLAPVRAVVTDATALLGRATLLAFGLGLAGLLVLGPVAQPSVGTAMQAHAVVNLAIGALVVGWLLGRPDDTRLGAVALGCAAAGAALFVFATGFEYFADGRRYLFAVARLIEMGIQAIV